MTAAPCVPCARCGYLFLPQPVGHLSTYCPLCYAYLRWIKARPVNCGEFTLWVLPADVRELS